LSMRDASREASVILFCEHDSSEPERKKDDENPDRTDRIVGKVSTDGGQRTQMRRHRYEYEIADNIIVVG